MVLPYQQIFTFAKIGPFTFAAWGTMVALGFLAVLWIISREAQKRGADSDRVYELFLSVFIGGILGARIGWLLTEGWGIGFFDALKIWHGGMIWHGGFIGAFLAFYGYSKWKKLDLWKHADLFAIGIPLGHAIGRIGCHLIGDHVGKQTALPWGINLGGAITHPISLYEMIALFAIFGIVYKLKDQKKFDGWLFSIYILSYASIRFLLDFLRVDPTYGGLTIAQYVSLGLIVASGWLILKSR